MEDNYLVGLDDLYNESQLYTPEIQPMPEPQGLTYSVYTVQPNDNLSKIARGDINLTRAIAYENRLKNPKLIRTNDLLLIPNNYDYTDNQDYIDYINNVYSPAISQFVAQRNARLAQQNQYVQPEVIQSNQTEFVTHQEQTPQIEDRSQYLNQVFSDLNNNSITPQEDGLIYGYYPEIWEQMPESRKEQIVRSNELNQFEQEQANARIQHVKNSINEEQFQKKQSDIYTYNPQNDSALKYLTSDDGLEKADIAEAFKQNYTAQDSANNHSELQLPDTAFFTPDSTIMDDYNNDSNNEEQLIILNNLPLTDSNIGTFNTWMHNISDKALDFYLENTENTNVKHWLNKEKNKRFYQHGNPSSVEQAYENALLLDPTAIVSVDQTGHVKIINGDNSVYELNSDDFKTNLKEYNQALFKTLGANDDIVQQAANYLDQYVDTESFKNASSNMILSYLTALEYFDQTNDDESFLTNVFLKLSDISDKVQNHKYNDKYDAESDMGYLALFGNFGRDLQLQLIESLPKQQHESEIQGNIIMPSNPDHTTYSDDALYLSNKYLSDNVTKEIFDDRLYNAVNAIGQTMYNAGSPVLDVIGGDVATELVGKGVKKIADSSIVKLGKLTSEFVAKHPDKAIQMILSPEKQRIFKEGLAKLALKRETSPMTNLTLSMLDYTALNSVANNAISTANNTFDLGLSEQEINIASNLIAIGGTTAGSIMQYKAAQKEFNRLVNKTHFNQVENALFDSMNTYNNVLTKKYAEYMSHPSLRTIFRNSGYAMPDVISYLNNDKSFYDFLKEDMEFNTAASIATSMLASAFSGGSLEGLVKGGQYIKKSVSSYLYSHSGGFDEFNKVKDFLNYLSPQALKRDLAEDENRNVWNFISNLSLNKELQGANGEILTKNGHFNWQYKFKITDKNAQLLTHDVNSTADKLALRDILRLKAKNIAFYSKCLQRDGEYIYSRGDYVDRFPLMKQDEFYDDCFNGETAKQIDAQVDRFLNHFDTTLKQSRRAFRRFQAQIKTKKGLYGQVYQLNKDAAKNTRSDGLQWQNGFMEINVPDMQYRNKEIGEFGQELGSFVFGKQGEKNGKGLLGLAQDEFVRQVHSDRSGKGRFARGIFLGDKKALKQNFRAIITQDDGSEKIVPLFKNGRLNPEIKLTKENHQVYGEMPFAWVGDSDMPIVYNSKGHWELPLIDDNGERIILNMDFSGTGSGGLSNLSEKAVGNFKTKAKTTVKKLAVKSGKKLLDNSGDEQLIFFSLGQKRKYNYQIDRAYEPSMLHLDNTKLTPVAQANNYDVDQLIEMGSFLNQFKDFVNHVHTSPSANDVLMFNSIMQAK